MRAPHHTTADTTPTVIFAADFGVTPAKWSGFNVSRLLRATGERPERVAVMWSLLVRLGMGYERHWPSKSGVFDHGEMWARSGFPWLIVGHPYGIDADERIALAELARFPGLRVGIDDRPSYYGHRTNHVRIELVERHRPWKPYPSTCRTRAAARAARKAFEEALS